MAKILVADDSDFMCDIIQQIGKEAGHKVFAVANGEALLEHYQKVMPDMVILDVVMPGKSGIETLQELKKKYADAKIVMCSALVKQENIMDKALEAGACFCIPKPFQKEQLLEAISACLK